ncbi:Cell surface glycan-binding lipoprotein, utilization system for glycans and polysaccharides (PUL), SusD family [Bacteroides ovatus]|uniref:RagB/SusD family nutrient uptake outer membrane protein n=1 Tax=Bacteroides TaxID=816 RepID=UPI0018F14308|nr:MULTISPECIES: RagB/SusD family nutrient uptake outer membrane protein [Bacteroides]MCS3176715.1 RagB/SusD family nutrient uptake outer membrane protein [Candidatus Bacteroides intestinigallinarum]CAG9902178.1 Cell surface glycan-binding lipoprotein, utilization system for glycans and polysaccharides (PUL), SusD family [Bacteroides ovatus]
MIRNKYLTFLGVGLLFMASACNDGYEKEPVEQFTLDYLFSKVDSAGIQSRYFLNNIYLEHLYSGYNRINGDFLDAASDDAISINNNEPEVYKLFMGRYSAVSRLTDMEWGEYYQGIRKANILINNIDVVPFNLTYVNALGETKPLNYTMKAEARFLRAHFYFELVKRYGGVPLVGDNVYVLGDDVQLPRNTFAQCIDYIVRELDEIKDDLRSLPMSDATEFAHTPTKEACLAMKARVLLYAASPLFNENPLEVGNELIGYASYNSERWNLAAKAAKDLIDQYGPNGKGTLNLAQDYRNIFVNFYGGNNPELIFFRPVGKNKNVETANGPLGFSGNSLGNGNTNPTQNLVESFLMKDGKKPGESTKYIYNSVDDPFKDRDPRLDFTVLHNGSRWLNTSLDTQVGGTHNPSGAQYSRTCYYIAKFMKDYQASSNYDDDTHLWVMYRYGEVLLNYAEALNEVALSGGTIDKNEVINSLAQLRKRAGIEPGDDNNYGLPTPENYDATEMRDIIRNERRIEMAFEEQRYWDIRRWRIAETIFKKPLRGLSIQIVGNKTNYYEVDVLSAGFDTKRYFYPIPYSEVIKNGNMIQNPNW